MTELAVIVPTRSRPHNIDGIIDAWCMTGAFGAADLYFQIDVDDAAYREYATKLSTIPEVRSIVMPEWQPMVPKLNAAALELAQRYPQVAFMGDDHLPRTPLWAHQLIQAHAMGGWGIVYGQDGIQDRRLPTWWSMSSRIILALKKMVPAPVQHLYCDNAVKTLGEEAKVIHYLDTVLIEHMHPVAGKGEMDAQYERVNRHQQYARDREAFRAWLQHGLARDVTILANLGG